MKMTLTKVRNITGRNGVVKNQFIIETERGRFFQSYESMIVFISNEGKTILDKTYWDYSKTTGKYRNLFLGEKKEVTEKKIKDGTYELVNLNG